MHWEVVSSVWCNAESIRAEALSYRYEYAIKGADGRSAYFHAGM